MPLAVYGLALASALTSAVATVFIRQGLRGGDTYSGFLINLVVGTVGMWTAVAATGPHSTPSPRGIAFFVLAGLIGTVAGRLFRFAGINKVGAAVAAAVMNLHPFVASVLAIAVLGERVTWPVVAGTAVIVGGTTLLSASGGQLGFRPVYLLLPFMSATCFGVVAVLRKLGLAGMGAIPGFAVNVTTALVAFTAFLLVSGEVRTLRCTGWSAAHFALAGVAENGSVFMALVALGLGTVSVVSPLGGTAPIFVLALSALFLRGIDRLTARVVAGSVLIVLGICLITAL